MQTRGAPLFDSGRVGKKAREVVHVQLLKVKSHIGIEGNEKADALAHEACKPDCCNDIASERSKSERTSSGLTLTARRFTMPLEELQPLLWMF